MTTPGLHDPSATCYPRGLRDQVTSGEGTLPPASHCHLLASHSSDEVQSGPRRITDASNVRRTGMRASGITALGEPVEIFEVDELAPPAAGEVLIDVAAAGIG